MELLGINVQAVLFDKDGTLLDFPSIWIPWVQDIHEHLAKSIPACNLSLDELRKALGIRGADEWIDPKSPLAIATIAETETILSFLLYERGTPWDLAILHARESVRYANDRQNDSPSIRPIAGIKELLAELKEQKITLGVLTADHTEKACKQLGKAGLAHYFDFIIGEDQVRNGKPYPDMAYLARDTHGIPLSETIMIGDTNADMQLGKQAGVKATIGLVTYSKDEVAHLKDADFIIKGYDELLM